MTTMFLETFGRCAAGSCRDLNTRRRQTALLGASRDSLGLTKQFVREMDPRVTEQGVDQGILQTPSPVMSPRKDTI